MPCPYCTVMMRPAREPVEHYGWKCSACRGPEPVGDPEGVYFQRRLIHDMHKSAEPSTGWVPNCIEWKIAGEQFSLPEFYDRHALHLLVVNELEQKFGLVPGEPAVLV